MEKDCCSVSGCLNRLSYSNPHLKFYRFPFQDPIRLLRWTTYTKREENWKPTAESMICSEHFDEAKQAKLPVRRNIFPEESNLLELTEDTDVREVMFMTYSRIPITLTFDAKKLEGGGVAIG